MTAPQLPDVHGPRATQQVRLELLTGTPHDIRAVQRVLDRAPGYSHRVSGGPPSPTDAQDLFSTLPPEVGRAAKHVYGVVAGDEIVGCLDLVRGWPDPATAHIGLLVLDEAHTVRGLGRAAYRALEDVARLWPEVYRLRATVVATNDVVLPFWHTMGLTETGETKPYQRGSVTSHAIVLTTGLETVGEESR